MDILKSLNNRLRIFLSRKLSPTERIISFWQKDGVDFGYYKAADDEEWLQTFWSNESLFYDLFTKLDTTLVLEIACGSGRHAAKIVQKMKHLWLLDTSKAALELAHARFKDFKNVDYIFSKKGAGILKTELPDESVTAVFSYDAMVHFEPDCVRQYIIDSYRVLMPGGQALLHHSNYTKSKTGVFSDNPGWRNYMSQKLFASYAKEAGFQISDSKLISWAEQDSDCITLLQKTA